VLLHNNDINPWPGQPLRTVRMDYSTGQGNSQTGDKFEVYVTNYQGQVGNNFRVYFTAQGSQNTLGAMAPCQDTTSRPEISGITCSMTGTPPAALGPAPAAPANLSVQ
jgi:hypothetical protein